MTPEPSPYSVTVSLARDQVQPMLYALADAIEALHLKFGTEDDDAGVERERIERLRRNLQALNSLEVILEGVSYNIARNALGGGK